jgi:putative membrane protein
MMKSKLSMMAFAIATLAITAGCQPASQNSQANNQNAQTSQPQAVPQADQTTTATLTSQEFVTRAAQSSLAEVQLSELALQKTSSDQVRSYAQQMIQDHTQANNELKLLASQKNLTVPTTLDPQHQAAKANLSGLSGQAFDTAYMQQMEQDHVKAVALFRQEASQGQDADLKSWAAATLPKLENHERMAKDMSGATSLR